jgi:serine protease Do
MVKDLLPQLRKGRVVRGTIGITIQKITPELKHKLNLIDEKGALVSHVVPGGAADKAGIRRGDVIVAFDGKDIKESSELSYTISSTPIGKVVTVAVVRRGQKIRFGVPIEELKEDVYPLAEMEESKKGMGMTVTEINPELSQDYGLPESSGILVLEVDEYSPAAESGLMPGDIIIEMDQTPVKDMDLFFRSLMAYKKGDTILFLVSREGVTIYLTLNV